MLQFVRGLLLGVVTGAALGVIARALMRLVAIGMGVEPELHLDASLALVGLFVISGAGAGAAATLGVHRHGWRQAIVVASSAPLLLMGAAFASGEVEEILDSDLTPPWTAELLAMSVVIVAAVVLTPYVSWRQGRGQRVLDEPVPTRDPEPQL